MSRVGAVLFDRDGTLVHDVPYNADPDLVRPVEGAREALGALRAHGVRTGVVTNQSGVARGLLTVADVRRVNQRVDALLGPFDVWAVCPHGPGDGCPCRKPRPGMILWAAGRLRTDPADCVVIGDIGADVEAARRAGAHGILVPTPRTRPEETAAAAHVAPDLATAVRAVLDGPPWRRTAAARPPGAGGGEAADVTGRRA
ncbi:HAD family hydrolase [Streptomyces viridosporus]|uniref:D-glycero-alpha-D-manno-heptose-1,7-bisphosphate 7-phosphatase n=1 Tax=Streptomyces viridosporus TaxID=67581 RepID=UPI00332102AA